jgi:hypothetical protein
VGTLAAYKLLSVVALEQTGKPRPRGCEVKDVVFCALTT